MVWGLAHLGQLGSGSPVFAPPLPPQADPPVYPCPSPSAAIAGSQSSPCWKPSRSALVKRGAGAADAETATTSIASSPRQRSLSRTAGALHSRPGFSMRTQLAGSRPPTSRTTVFRAPGGGWPRRAVFPRAPQARGWGPADGGEAFFRVAHV